jgi:hypothetical protein
MELIDKNPFNTYNGKIKVEEAIFLTQEFSYSNNKTSNFHKAQRQINYFQKKKLELK